MATSIYSMQNRSAEQERGFSHTPVSQHFISVMRHLSSYIEAERDLEHAGGFDPAFDCWFVDAERARVQVLNTLANHQAIPAKRHADLPLKRIAVLTQRLIQCDNPTTFAQLLCIPNLYPDLFSDPARHLVAKRINLMVGTCRAQLEDLARLSEHSDDFTAAYAQMDELIHAAAA